MEWAVSARPLGPQRTASRHYSIKTGKWQWKYPEIFCLWRIWQKPHTAGFGMLNGLWGYALGSGMTWSFRTCSMRFLAVSTESWSGMMTDSLCWESE